MVLQKPKRHLVAIVVNSTDLTTWNVSAQHIEYYGSRQLPFLFAFMFMFMFILNRATLAGQDHVRLKTADVSR